MDTDNQYGVDTLAPLRDQDVPPLDVSIERAVATGRRRQRNRAVAAVSAGVLAVTGGIFALSDQQEAPAPAPVVAEPGLRCTVAELPVPEGAEHATATAVSADGRFAAGAVLGSEETGVNGTALIWDNGQLRELTVKGLSPTPLAVNSNGTVVGGVTRDHRQEAWSNRGGTIANLPELPGHQMVAFDVNDRGDIVGTAFGPEDDDKAVIWPADRPTLVFPLSGPGASGASGISAEGLVVGTADDRPYVWDANRVGRPLTGLSGQTTGTATDITGDWVLGTSGNRPARWNLSRRTVEPIAGMEPAGITATGALVGTDDVPAATPPFKDALVRRTGTAVALPALTGPRNYEAATATSADGRVIAGEHAVEKGSSPTLWHC